MNSTLLSEWYSKNFIPEVKKLGEHKGKTGKVLLILDNAPCHPPVEILNAIDDDCKVMYLPPNVTALINIKDVCYMLAEALDSLERQSLKTAWNKARPDLEAKKDFNDDHREEITDFS
ncbi:HTH CENPB-type domain-containing protein [Trichonephila clavipes]|nr:HTH CENPB-type domain-containing protein [Trichonephila clavipes]